MSARSASAALQLNCGPKVERGAGEKFEDFETHFRIKLCYRLVKFHGAPHKVPNYMGGGPHGILIVSNTILYENEFQNLQIFHQHLRFSPKRSTLDTPNFCRQTLK
jgi:hypothetical protein